MAQSFRLDPILCDGYGMCAEILPELITVDEWGYPVIEPGPIPAGLLPHARRAVDVCPALALRLRNVEAAPALPRRAPAARALVPQGGPARGASRHDRNGPRAKPRARAAGT